MGENHQVCTHVVAIALLTLAANGEHAQAASTSSGQACPTKPIRMIVKVLRGTETQDRLIALGCEPVATRRASLPRL